MKKKLISALFLVWVLFFAFSAMTLNAEDEHVQIKIKPYNTKVLHYKTVSVLNQTGEGKFTHTGTKVLCLKTVSVSNICNQNYRSTNGTLAENVEPISIYPNPAQNELYVSLPENNADLVIYNYLGINLLQTKIDNGTGKFDISTLGSGIYFLTTTTNNKTYIVSFIKY
jgi:hypothetical protein